MSLHLTAIGASRTESIPIELRHIRGGTRVTVLGNEGTDDPIIICATLDSRLETVDITMRFAHPGKRVLPTLQLTRVMSVLREGGQLHLSLPDGKLLAGEPKLDINRLPAVWELEAWERLLIVLAEIQPRVARYGYFKLTTRISDADLQKAEQVRAMCTRGAWETHMNIAVTLKVPPVLPDAPPIAEPKVDSVEFEIDPFGEVVLFGVRIPMGRVRVIFLDGCSAKAAFAQAQADQSTDLKFVDASVLLKYLEWEHPNSGPEFTALGKRDPKSKHVRGPTKREKPKSGSNKGRSS
jgi:hypothetical protein